MSHVLHLNVRVGVDEIVERFEPFAFYEIVVFLGDGVEEEEDFLGVSFEEGKELLIGISLPIKRLLSKVRINNLPGR